MNQASFHFTAEALHEATAIFDMLEMPETFSLESLIYSQKIANLNLKFIRRAALPVSNKGFKLSLDFAEIIILRSLLMKYHICNDLQENLCQLDLIFTNFNHLLCTTSKSLGKATLSLQSEQA
jgi:hypothetical protein